jgi:hypothetical protein
MAQKVRQKRHKREKRSAQGAAKMSGALAEKTLEDISSL